MGIRNRILSASLLLSLSNFLSQGTQPTPIRNFAAQQHIKEIITALPVDGSLRRTLDAGHFGNGIHQSWMDEMKRIGVKMAVFEIHGVWRTSLPHFEPRVTKRSIYRKNYDGPGSQITDTHELSQLRESGLTTKLQEAAFHESEKAVWIGIDSPPKDGDACIVEVFLFDDEWLADDAFSTNLPRIGRYNPEEFLLGYAAADGDALTVRQQLSKQQFSRQRLNIALFQSVAYPSDNTDVILLLLGAGANINAEQSDGTTPLMAAVATLNLSNIKLLLSSGADVNRKTINGWSAYSLAEQQVKQLQENKASIPAYMPEMLKLLKPRDNTL